MISTQSLLLALTLCSGSALANPLARATTTTGAEPDPSFAVSVKLGGQTYVNKVGACDLILLAETCHCCIGYALTVSCFLGRVLMNVIRYICFPYATS